MLHIWLEEGKKPEKQREAELDTRSSSDPIKKLLRYWRLNVSDVLIPPSSRRVPIFFLFSVCVLCISLANRRRGFSSVSFHLSPFLSFAFCVTKMGSRLCSCFRVDERAWEDWPSSGCVSFGLCSWGKVSGDGIARVREREMLWLANCSPLVLFLISITERVAYQYAFWVYPDRSGLFPIFFWSTVSILEQERKGKSREDTR